MIGADEFTRWCCPKCGQDGIDSWNKAVWDGPGYASLDEVEFPHIIGGECWRCWWPIAVAYFAPGDAPRAILAPADDDYSYEDAAFADLADPASKAAVLAPAQTRDADWSGGCIAARGQLQ